MFIWLDTKVGVLSLKNCVLGGYCCLVAKLCLTLLLWPRLLCMELPRQKYWSGFVFPNLADLANPGLKPMSPALAGGFVTTEPLGKPKGGYIYIYVYIHIPSFTAGKRISWSFLPAFFSCLTIHMCSFFMEFSVTVSQLSFMYVSLVFMVFPCWDGRTLLPFFSFQETLITSGKNFSRRQRYVAACWWWTSLIEGRKIVGLGKVSEGSFLSAEGDRKEFKMVIRETRRTWNKLACNKRKKTCHWISAHHGFHS